MRILLILWLGPIFILSAWYGLSYYDINFGTRVLSRELHDLVFHMYGNLLGMPPAEIPIFVGKAIAFDSLFIIAIVAFRMRKSWWPTAKSWFVAPEGMQPSGQGTPVE